MKLYKGLEIQEVVETMNAVMYSTDLTEEKDSYNHLLSGYGAMFLSDETICFVADDNKSFLLANVSKEDCLIEVDMWAGMNGKIGFRAMFEYIAALKNIFEGETRDIRIMAKFRITTSLPIMEKLIDKYGMEIEYIDEEENGFRTMSVIYDPVRY